MNAVNSGAAKDALLSDGLACEVNDTVTEMTANRTKFRFKMSPGNTS